MTGSTGSSRPAGVRGQAQKLAASIVRSFPGNGAWVQAANDLGLQSKIGLGPQTRSMYGYIDGVDVWVRFASRSGETRVLYEIRYASVAPPLRMQRLIKLRRIGMPARFGRGVEIGDPWFDEQLFIETDFPDELINYLSTERRAAVARFFSQDGERLIVNNTLTVFDWVLAFAVPSNLVATVNELVEIATIMRGFADEDDRTALDSAPVVPARPIPTPTPPIPDSSPPRVAPQPTGLEQQHVIDDLFDGSLARYDAIERFAAQYSGRKVVWRGEVERFSPYRDDTDFGDGPGVKAVVLIGTPGRSQLISAEVRAVIQLAPAVALRTGNVISFSGTLRRVDRFSRQIYITDAAIS